MSTATKYRNLLTKYAPQPIGSVKAYRLALAQLEQLMVPRPDAASRLLIEVLATLIEKYESREYPASRVAPPAMLIHLLKAKGVRRADVGKSTGIPRSTLSNVLAHRRGISLENAFKLGDYFGVSPMVFLANTPRKRPTAKPKRGKTSRLSTR